MKLSLICMLFFSTLQLFASEQLQPQPLVEVAQAQDQVQQEGGCVKTTKKIAVWTGIIGGTVTAVVAAIASAWAVAIVGGLIGLGSLIARYGHSVKEFVQNVVKYTIKTLQRWGREISRLVRNIFKKMYQKRLDRKQAWADFWNALKACECGPACTSLVKWFCALITSFQGQVFFVGLVLSIIGSINIPEIEWYGFFGYFTILLAYVLERTSISCKGDDQRSLEEGLARSLEEGLAPDVLNVQNDDVRSIQGTIAPSSSSAGADGLTEEEVAHLESLRPSRNTNRVRNYQQNQGNRSQQTTSLSSN